MINRVPATTRNSKHPHAEPVSANELKLCNKPLSEEQIEEVCAALSTTAFITSVNLANTQLNDQALMRIAKALEKNASVQKLNLSVNQISDEGANYLAQALTINTSLTSLHILFNNNISNTGISAFLNALTINTSLTEFMVVVDDPGNYNQDLLQSIDEQIRINQDIVRLLEANTFKMHNMFASKALLNLLKMKNGKHNLQFPSLLDLVSSKVLECISNESILLNDAKQVLPIELHSKLHLDRNASDVTEEVRIRLRLNLFSPDSSTTTEDGHDNPSLKFAITGYVHHPKPSLFPRGLHNKQLLPDKTRVVDKHASSNKPNKEKRCTLS